MNSVSTTRHSSIGTIGVFGGPEFHSSELGAVFNTFKTRLSELCPESIGPQNLCLTYSLKIAGSIWTDCETKHYRRQFQDGHLLFASFGIGLADVTQGTSHFANTYCRMVLESTHLILEYAEKKKIDIDKPLVLRTMHEVCRITLLGLDSGAQ